MLFIMGYNPPNTKAKNYVTPKENYRRPRQAWDYKQR